MNNLSLLQNEQFVILNLFQNLNKVDSAHKFAKSNKVQNFIKLTALPITHYKL